MTPNTEPARVFDIADCVFTIPEAAAHLRVSRSYFYELVAAKKISPFKLGKRSLVKGGELRKFLKSISA